MQDLLHIIRQQLVLCLRLFELTKEQANALVHTAAPAVQRLTKEIEAVIIDLNRLEKRRQDFLRQQGCRDAAAWVDGQPEGLEKDMALQLLKKQAGLLQKLKEATGNNLQYLNKNIEYIDYNVNVITQTAAGVTYGTPGDNGGMPIQGSKMFEANV